MAPIVGSTCTFIRRRHCGQNRGGSSARAAALADLNKTFVQAKDAEGFPFPIVADPGLAAFKAYRTYDDFESQALHGTFLIDAAGYVRWQDISSQPFGNVKWLLTESKRLLAMPVNKAAGTVSK